MLRRKSSDLREVDPLDGVEKVNDCLEGPALELPVGAVGHNCDDPKPLGLRETLHAVADLKSPHLPHDVAHNLDVLRPRALKEAHALLVLLVILSVLQELRGVQEVHRRVLVARHQDDRVAAPATGHDQLLELLQQRQLVPRPCREVLLGLAVGPFHTSHLILGYLQDEVCVWNRPAWTSNKDVEVLDRSNSCHHVGVRDLT
mmetsp:Transcript_11149/g.35384  ORF Transcript_11149/g.35384 Transcript_11149/m.35384 type:complete len:202 (-) Transcript_11149:599-1204(-)